MIWIYLILAFILGAVAMLVFVIWSLQRAINRADISRDDRYFINDILGIPNE